VAGGQHHEVEFGPLSAGFVVWQLAPR
jgi:hypothetical protein